MCNTLTYCDLGKAAKVVFNKGYGFGMVKIDLRTKSCSMPGNCHVCATFQFHSIVFNVFLSNSVV
uniref:Uncharacterized protein n=1 Tax=Rhinolophus ferrumequinum TaxID=59479 RepID=A0A671FGI8_RHIFE